MTSFPDPLLKPSEEPSWAYLQDAPLQHFPLINSVQYAVDLPILDV
jgi:hypothetical protein